MDSYESDYNDNRHQGEFHTHRSERYRHPERGSQHRFDNYGSPARGSYGTESQQGTWGNQGNEMGGSRRYTDINVTPYDRFEQSRNYGNMGSYGGAQGFGDMRGGHHDSDHPYDSGTGQHRRYSTEGRASLGNRGYREEGRDYSRHNRYGSNRENLYGREVSRRFEGQSGQERYDFERDDYYSSNYGDDQGNYMGSGYNRDTRSRYGEGEQGASGSTQSRRQSGSGSDWNENSGREFNTARNRWNTDW